ncbi:hypothetical protein [Zhouia amylolytica]|uniref:hypothetical protein n=1 Tax=Zhouia amylolytica TaxID=376730 RepID=UPI0020CD2710|nr:hypothetical protein [Zhouia amylolytica]MCQ0110931.1 hypothetical protein [Zhouia amylolytica]
MKLYKIMILLLTMSTMIGCENDDSDDTISGTYQGTFTVTDPEGQTFTKDVTVIFSGNQYSSSLRGSGSYIQKSKTMIFSDKNIWTAEFDWGLILNGVYAYEFGKNSLQLTKGNGEQFPTYQYDLVKSE